MLPIRAPSIFQAHISWDSPQSLAAAHSQCSRFAFQAAAVSVLPRADPIPDGGTQISPAPSLTTPRGFSPHPSGILMQPSDPRAWSSLTLSEICVGMAEIIPRVRRKICLGKNN